ncbi:MAG: hypothetical protein HN353_13465 [Bdellovibrionales bacterium]|nr:hypothetical protein [Bdellovibrionales bacterium]MBT3524899.1 hypothetical protein [Bdellovibrionales bacterium]MBT7669036.1 hypothetical protein [Bdellovibrionales bacterium]MBT7766805.1 hypothetical protein [Bdellovibrionales bacterium]
MEFNFSSSRRNKAQPRAVSSGDDDRLQRAIERNKAKQRKRGMQSQGADLPGARVGTLGDRTRNISASASRQEGQDEFLEQLRQRKQHRHHQEMASGRDSNLSERRTVGRADNVEFTSSLKKRGVKKEEGVLSKFLPDRPVGGQKSKIISARQERLVRSRPAATTRLARSGRSYGKLVTYLTRAGWLVCVAMMVNLTISEGGVLDFYAKKRLLTSYQWEHQTVLDENDAIELEIKRIRSDHRYQKRLVRDHLGFILKSEFLILFPRKVGEST